MSISGIVAAGYLVTGYTAGKAEQACIKEREFYVAFLERLEKL